MTHCVKLPRRFSVRMCSEDYCACFVTVWYYTTLTVTFSLFLFTTTSTSMPWLHVIIPCFISLSSFNYGYLLLPLLSSHCSPILYPPHLSTSASCYRSTTLLLLLYDFLRLFVLNCVPSSTISEYFLLSYCLCAWVVRSVFLFYLSLLFYLHIVIRSFLCTGPFCLIALTLLLQSVCWFAPSFVTRFRFVCSPFVSKLALFLTGYIGCPCCLVYAKHLSCLTVSIMIILSLSSVITVSPLCLFT